MIWYDEKTTIKLLDILEDNPEWYTVDDLGFYKSTNKGPKELDNFFQFLNEQNRFNALFMSKFKKEINNRG